MRLSSIFFLLIHGVFCHTTIEQISEITTDFNKSFRPKSPNTQNTVELIIAASSDLSSNNIQSANTYLYCLGSTKIEIQSVGRDDENGIKIAVADSLVEVRDKLQKQMPNKVWSGIRNGFSSAFKSDSETESDKVVKLPTRTIILTLSPYQEKYVAITSKHPIRVIARRTKVNMNSVLLLLFGVWLFIYSPEIAKQAAFYYVSGVSLSVTFGALIMLYFLINRLIPKRDSVLVVGLMGSVGVWMEWFFNGFLRQTVFGLLKQNWVYVAIYFGVFGGGGFVYCYIKGPPTENPRAHNVLKVFLWLIASGLIVSSFNLSEIGFGVLGFVVISWCFYPKSDERRLDESGMTDDVETVDNGNKFGNNRFDDIRTQGQGRFKGLLNSPAVKNDVFTRSKNLKKVEKFSSGSDTLEYTPVAQHTFPKPAEKENISFISSIFRTKKKSASKTNDQTPYSPATETDTPTRRLLSENEYLSQGIDCTQVELNKLRSIMNESQTASPWRYIPKLQDPKRFAEFVTGSPHVSRVELSAYEEDLDSIISGGEWEEGEGVNASEKSGKSENGENSGNSESENSDVEANKSDENSENRNISEKRKNTPEEMIKHKKKLVNSTSRKIKANTPTSLKKMR